VHFILITVPLALLVEGRDSALVKLPLFFAATLGTVAVYISGALRRGRLEIQSSPLEIPVLLIVFGAFLSAVITWQPGVTGRAAALLAACSICVVAGSTLFTERTHIERLCLTIAAVATVVATLGIAQFYFGESLPVQFYLGPDRRPGSTLGSPIFLSSFIVLIFPFLLVQLFRPGRRGLPFVLLSVLLAALGFLLLATGTRSSIAAFALSLVVLTLLMRNQRRAYVFWAVILSAGATLIALLFVPGFGQRLGSTFAQGAHSSFARRLTILEAGMHAFLNSPWVGHGLGTFETVFPAFRSPDYWIVGSEDIVPHAHCELLEIGVEIGIGGILLAILIGAIALRAGIRCSRGETPQSALLSAGITAGLVGAFADGMLNVSLRQAPVAAISALFMGLLMSPGLTGDQRTVGISFRKFRWFAWGPVLLCLIGLVPYSATQIRAVESQRLLIRGIVAESEGHLTNAADLCYSAATRDPSNLVALFECARAQLAAGRASDATGTITTLHQRSPGYPKSNLIKAAALLRLGVLPAASGAIDREIQQRDHPEAFAVQARILYALRDTSGVRRALRNLLDACVRGAIDYHLEAYADEFVAASRSQLEFEDARIILQQVSNRFPDVRTVQSLLQDLDRRIRFPPQ